MAAPEPCRDACCSACPGEGRVAAPGTKSTGPSEHNARLLRTCQVLSGTHSEINEKPIIKNRTRFMRNGRSHEICRSCDPSLSGTVSGQDGRSRALQGCVLFGVSRRGKGRGSRHENNRTFGTQRTPAGQLPSSEQDSFRNKHKANNKNRTRFMRNGRNHEICRSRDPSLSGTVSGQDGRSRAPQGCVLFGVSRRGKGRGSRHEINRATEFTISRKCRVVLHSTNKALSTRHADNKPVDHRMTVDCMFS